MSTSFGDSGVGSPTSNEDEIGWGHGEDGDHPYPLQESIDSTGSPSRLVVGPPSSPLTPRLPQERGQARSGGTTDHLLRQPISTVTDPSSPSNTGESAHPCSPIGAVHVQIVSSTFQGSSLNLTGAMASTASSQGSQKLVKTDGQVAKYSIEFGRVTEQILTAVKEDKKEGLLLNIVAEMTGPDPDDSIFHGAAEASTIEEFFRLGRKERWWHWLDFERLLLILEELKNDCPRALRILQQYMKRLSDGAKERLSELDEEPPCDEGHWIKMKCQCNHANLTLKAIKEHKQFLVDRLGVPPLAFTYCDAYEGCMVTVWRVHSEVQFAEAKKKLLSIEGCSKTEEPGRETLKVTLFTPFPDLFTHVKQGTLDVDSLTEVQLCAVNDSWHTLLSLAVECNQPGIVEKLLEKGLSNKVKDFKATEMKQTAINIAAHKDYCACLQALIRHGCHPAVPDVAGKLALQYACSNDCVTCVVRICEAPGTASLTGLDWTSHFLDKACVSEAIVEEIKKAEERRQCEVVSPALFEAARSGEFSCAAHILEDGDDMNDIVKSESGEWPLYVAAQYGHLDVMKTLKEYACNIQVVGCTNEGNTILHAAVLSGRADVVSYTLQLIAKELGFDQLGSDVNAINAKRESALELATLSDAKEIVELLLSNGAHPCIPSSCGELLTSSNEDICLLLDQHRKMHWLEIEKAMSVLSQFADVWQVPFDYNLRTPLGENILMMAAKQDKSDVVEFLLDSLDIISDDGCLTKFEVALPQGSDCQCSSLPIVPEAFHDSEEHTHSKFDAKPSSPLLRKYLLMVNPHDGFTVAHYAAAGGRLNSLTHILERSHPMSCAGIQNKQGNTPLHLAAAGNHTACIEKLMEFSSNADVCTHNKKGIFADELLGQMQSIGLKLRSRRETHSRHVIGHVTDPLAEICVSRDDTTGEKIKDREDHRVSLYITSSD